LASADAIPPGGEGKIIVSFSAGTRRRTIRQAVAVQTNDPEQPDLRLTATANVLADLEVMQPGILKFTDNPPKPAQVAIKNYANVPVKLTKVTFPRDKVAVSVSSRTIPAGGKVVVQAELLPDVPEGILSGWVTLQTNLKSMPTLQIRVWGRVQ
jgi:hypothetical protein